jgi:hypothetical protein
LDCLQETETTKIIFVFSFPNKKQMDWLGTTTHPPAKKGDDDTPVEPHAGFMILFSVLAMCALVSFFSDKIRDKIPSPYNLVVGFCFVIGAIVALLKAVHKI